MNTQYSEIMKTFDILLDKMEKISPDNFSILQKRDIQIYFNNYLQQEVNRLTKYFGGTFGI